MLDHLIFIFMTLGTRAMYHIKLVLNLVIFSLLSYIVASNIIGDDTPLKKAYISLSLIIIICLSIDKYIRSISLYIDFMTTITHPINLGVPMRKVIYYTRMRHLLLVGFLLLLEDIKIMCAIFCIIDLNYQIQNGTYIIYCLLSLLLAESTLGLIIYFFRFILIATRKDFFIEWCTWMANWYISEIVKVHIYKINNNIYLEMTDIHSQNHPQSHN